MRVWPWVLGTGLLSIFDYALGPDSWLALALLPVFLLPQLIVAPLVFLRIRRASTTRQALGILWRRKWMLLWAFVGTGLMLALGVALLILPVFYFLARNAFATLIAVSEAPGFADKPLQASDYLTRGIRFRLVALYLIALAPSLIAVYFLEFRNAGDFVYLVVFPFDTLATGMLYGCLGVACEESLRRRTLLAS